MYSGMLETITIRKAGYPIRYDFDYFTGRYDVCCGNLRHNPNYSPRDKCKAILTKVLPKQDWKVGHTKVFMKDGQEVRMERAREEALLKYIITIQRSTRGWLRRRRVKRLNATILMIQTLTRAAQARVAYNQMKVGYARLQAVWKAHKLQYKYNKIRNFIIRLQTRSRGYLIRNSRFKRNDAVVVIQSYVRGLLARRYHKRELQKNEIQKLPKSEQKKRMAEFDAEEKKQLAALLANKRRLKEAQRNDQKDIEEIDNMFKDLENGVGDFDDLDDGNIEYIEDVNQEVGNQQGEFSDDLSAYTFMKYATTYFTSSVSHTHLRRPLKEPLLHHDDEVDRSASLSIWITILRFMLDMSEPRNTATTDNRPESTIIRLQRIIGRAQKTKAKAMMETQSGRKTRIYSAADGFREFTDNRTTHLTKIQFIIGMGIVRPELRDEIFCQICKQLTQNRNRQGVQRGWMLMALCLGCFGPSEKFEKYLRCFLRENQPRHYHFYEGKLNRTIKNGVRQWPPNTVEIRAARNRKQIQVRVSLMDKTVHQVKADSATTAKEICLEIASLAGLDEGTYGFGLFISIFQRVSSLGGGREHLMDAIAQCEQISVEHSLAAESAPWQIIFRKEVFSPWYNPMVDPRASQLIRKQIISSLSFGEFPNVSDSKLANFAAQELTIQYGAAWNADAAAKVVREIVPEAKRKAEGPEAWNQKVKAALEKLKKENPLWKTSISSEQVQAHMLRQCRKEFSLPFSRFFQTRPVSRDAKFLSSEGTEMLIAVNWMGVFIVTTSETILANIRFSEIRQIELIRNVRDVPYGFTLETIQEKSFQFICSACEDIDEIVNTFVEGLRARSQFAVGKTDLPQHMVQEGDLACTRGDLIILDQVAGKALLSENEAHGRCERTGFSGNVRSENVWVVPTLLKPDEELVKLFKMTDVELERLNRKTMSAAQMDQTESSAKYYTLQEYAQDFFRNENKGKSSRGVIAFDKSKNQASWAKSTQPITQPLLIKTPDYLTSDAGHMFLAILKFCGDHPTGRTVNITDQTDPIFNLPLKKKELRDECYCQIMKQLTRNPKKTSEARAWKLFWLLCGLMPPSAQLYPHVSRFLSSRSENAMAMECSQRVYRVNRNGARRMPPHSTEVEAIQNETTQIYHFIHLGPSQELKEVFPLDSSMRAGDLVAQIAKRLRMKSHEGFSLFIFIADKMIAIKDDQFFFDVIRELSDALSRSGQSAADYKVHFMRKLWISFIPGKDSVSDKLFNFPQESKKYLRGFYDVDQKKAAELGAYLYTAFFDESALNRQALKKGQITTELVPQNVKFSMDKVRKDIEKQLTNLAGVSPDDAKFKFLKVLVDFPNFGSTFVECRQFGDSTLPEKIILAIHKRGITVLDPLSKTELMRKGYSEITNWSYGETYFSMSFGNLINGSKLICETTQGYKMENLVSSYIKQLEKTIKKTNAKTKSNL